MVVLVVLGAVGAWVFWPPTLVGTWVVSDATKRVIVDTRLRNDGIYPGEEDYPPAFAAMSKAFEAVELSLTLRANGTASGTFVVGGQEIVDRPPELERWSAKDLGAGRYELSLGAPGGEAERATATLIPGRRIEADRLVFSDPNRPYDLELVRQ